MVNTSQNTINLNEPSRGRNKHELQLKCYFPFNGPSIDVKLSITSWEHKNKQKKYPNQ